MRQVGKAGLMANRQHLLPIFLSKLVRLLCRTAVGRAAART